jgi:hypothetical protein
MTHFPGGKKAKSQSRDWLDAGKSLVESYQGFDPRRDSTRAKLPYFAATRVAWRSI